MQLYIHVNCYSVPYVNFFYIYVCILSGYFWNNIVYPSLNCV